MSFLRALAAAVLCGCLTAQVVCQQPPEIQYRRLLVPQESLESQIRGLLPLKRDEFERRLRLADGPTAQRMNPAVVRIDSARFRARLEAGRLQGTAELDIVASADQSVLLALEPCNVAVSSAAWREPREEAALLGIDPHGELRCVVPRSGTLSWSWTASAVESQPQQTTFVLRLPAAPRRTLEITAPANVALSANAGIVASRGAAGQEAQQRLWTIELPGSPEVRLFVRPIQAEHNAHPLVIVRESSNYTALSSTIDLDATFTLDLPALPARRLDLIADAGLRITAIQLDGESLAFSSAENPESLATSIGIELPRDLAGLSRTLQVTATADWPPESRWQLPRIAVANSVLQEGRTTIAAPAWLRLQARAVSGCVMAAVTPASAGRANDQFQFQVYETGATIELASDQSPPPLREESGTQITVDGSQVKGVLVADLATLADDRFTIEANIPRHWIVDSVETQPPEALADRVLAPRGANQQVLRLNLARPLTTSRHVQLIVRAHARRPPNGQNLPDGFFAVALFPDASESRRLVAVAMDEPGSEVTLTTDDGLTRLDPLQLAAADLQLFESMPSGLLVEINDADRPLRGALVAATARYRADVVTVARADAQNFRQRVSIRCLPDTSSVNSVLVRLAPRPGGPVSWKIAGAAPQEVVAASVSPLTEAGGAEADAVVYRLALPRARSLAFELIGEWSSKALPAGEISLAWLPEASVQTGVVEFHESDGANFVIAADEVQALPVARAPADESSTLRARYRYDASRGARIRVQPAPTGPTQRGAWVEMLHLTSYFANAGRSQHEAHLSVVNAGQSRMQIGFAHEVTDLRLVDDAGNESPLSSADPTTSISVPLPSGASTANVRLRFAAASPSPQIWLAGTLLAPVPEPDLPVLARRWTVGLPPGFRAADSRMANADVRPEQPAENSNWRSLKNILAGPGWGRKLLVNEHPSTGAVDPEFAGWTLIDADLPAGATATVSVYCPAVVTAWSLALALAAVAVALRFPSRAAWFVPAAALFAAAALVAPLPLAAGLASICGGLVAGSALALVRRDALQPASRNQSAAPPSTVARPLAPAAGSLLLVALPVAVLLGAPGENAPGENASGMASLRPRVVIPVDDNQQPAGDYVYLEPAFYEALHRRTDSGPAALAPWLLEHASFEFPVAARAEGAAAAVDELRAALEFHTFVPGAMLRLPFSRKQILLREGHARLDGQAVTLAWLPDGEGLTLAVESPGRHRLELSLGAIAQRTANGITLDLSLPRAAQSLVAPPAGGGEIVPQGAAFITAAEGTKQTVLAKGDRLSVRWPTAAGAPPAATGLLADQFLWWKIRPGSVVLEGKFRLQAIGGGSGEATITVDPRLRLLPGALAAGRISVEEGPQQLVKVQFAEPQSGPAILRLSWLWPDASGIGNLLLPKVQVQADRLDRQWTAISADSGLAINVPSGSRAASTTEFLQAWGESASPPAAVFDTRSLPADLPIAVRPGNRLPQAEQSIDWSLSSTAATAHLALRLNEVPETRLEHRLTMPLQLKVTDVKLTHSSKPVPVRWAQQSDGTLVVTLLEPAGPEQELTVAAELPLPRQRRRLPLFAVRLLDAELDSSTMRIYRQADVGIEVQSAAGWTQQDDPEIGGYRAGRGRLVARLRNEAAIGDTQPVVARSLNQPLVTGFAFIRAHEADGDWRGEVELALDVSNGVLDEVRLALPDHWTGPLELEPPLEHRLEDLPGERRRLVIRPTSAIADRFVLSIRGSLSSGEGGLAAPDVSVLGAPEIERLVLLDRGRSGQRIDWETTGLIAADAAAAPIPERWQGVGGELLRVVAPRFDATARPRQETAAAPRAHLAEIRLKVDASGRVAAVAHYTVRPAGALGLRCILPPDCRLVQALVDGVAMTATSAGPRTWELTTPSSVLPFELTIAYDGALSPADRGSDFVRLAAPRLVGVQIEETLWHASGGQSPMKTSKGSLMPVSPHEAAVLRLEAAARGLEDVATASTTDVPNSVLAGSAARWQGAIDLAHQRLPQTSGVDEESEGSVALRRAAAEALITRAQQRLSAVDLPESAESNASITASELLESDAVYFAKQGPAEELTIAIAPPATDKRTLARLCALLLTVVAVASGPILRWTAVRDWLAAHAHLLLALAGLSWWLIAPLGWLGWLPVLAALWLSVRFPQTSRPGDASWTGRRLQAAPSR